MKNYKTKPLSIILQAKEEAEKHGQNDLWDKGYMQAINDLIKERVGG